MLFIYILLDAIYYIIIKIKSNIERKTLFMGEILVVKNLKKTFKLSKKQQKINKTNELYKVAVNDLSFVAYKGEIYGFF